jgi:hypothetical protein
MYWNLNTSLEFEVSTALVVQSSMFCNITLCGPLKSIVLLVTCFNLAFCLTSSSTLNMKATYSSETPVDFQRTTSHYVPEDVTLINISVLCNCKYVRACYYSVILGENMYPR